MMLEAGGKIIWPGFSNQTRVGMVMVATGQEMVRGGGNSSRSGKCRGILFRVRGDWHFAEKSGKIEIVSRLI